MKKKGFTLVELLAVVAILGIMVLIALPNVIDSFKESKDNTFISESQGLYKAAKNQYVLDTAKGIRGITYVYGYDPIVSTDKKALNIDNREGLKYLIKLNDDGEIYYFLVEDDGHKIELGEDGGDADYVNFQDIDKSVRRITPSQPVTPAEPTIRPSSITTTTRSTTTTTTSLRPGRLASCDAGYYLSGGECYICMEGYYCTGGIEQPMVCPAGSTSAQGATNVKGCSIHSTENEVTYTSDVSRFTLLTTIKKGGYSYRVSNGKTYVSVYYNNVAMSINSSVTKVIKSGDVIKVYLDKLAGSTNIGDTSLKDMLLSITVDDTANSVVVYDGNTLLTQITEEEAGIVLQ